MNSTLAEKEDETVEEYVLYKGKEYIKTETEDEVILTSVEKKYGKKTILAFTKNTELAKQTEKETLDIIKKTIIQDYLEKEQA